MFDWVLTSKAKDADATRFYNNRRTRLVVGGFVEK